MMGISPAQWESYKATIRKAHDVFNQDTVTWARHSHGLQRYGEDSKSTKKTVNIELKCLMNYNVYRSWPMTGETTSGQIDNESVCIILNKEYLKELGYINANNNFDMDPGQDYFIHQGIKLRPAGETPAAQASDDPLLVYVIVRRTLPETGSNRY